MKLILRLTMLAIMVLSTITIVVMVLMTMVIEVPIEVAEFTNLIIGIIKKLIRIPSMFFIGLFNHEISATTSTITLTIRQLMITFTTSCMITHTDLLA